MLTPLSTLSSAALAPVGSQGLSTNSSRTSHAFHLAAQFREGNSTSWVRLRPLMGLLSWSRSVTNGKSTRSGRNQLPASPEMLAFPALPAFPVFPVFPVIVWSPAAVLRRHHPNRQIRTSSSTSFIRRPDRSYAILFVSVR